jgi:hypothetical protein
MLGTDGAAALLYDWHAAVLAEFQALVGISMVAGAGFDAYIEVRLAA